MKREIEIVLPEFKGSYVEYQVYNPTIEKLERFRIYKGFAKLNTEQEKQELAEKIVKQYSAKLRAGWRPWKSENIIYRDNFTYYSEEVNFGNKRKDVFYIRRHANDYYAKLAEKKLAKKSEQTYKSRIRTFLMWLEKNGFERLQPDLVTNELIQTFFAHLRDRNLDKETIANYRLTLFRLFEFFRESKILKTNPVHNIELPQRKKDYAARPMLDCDVEHILTLAAKKSPQFLLACLFQMLCCCRPNELRFIKIKDIDIYNKVLFIDSDGGKTGNRTVQMPNVLVEICREMCIYKHDREFYLFGSDGEPGPNQLPINKLGNQFREIRKSLGLPTTYKFYSFKHTGAGKLLESGATVIEVMKLLGHTSLESTIHYIHRHFGEKSEKVMNFYPDAIRNVAGIFRK